MSIRQPKVKIKPTHEGESRNYPYYPTKDENGKLVDDEESLLELEGTGTRGQTETPDSTTLCGGI